MATPELLRNAHAGLGVALVVFGHQLELQRLAAGGDLLRVEFLDGEAHAVFVVLARECIGTGEGAAMADLDDLLLRTGVACEGEGGQAHEADERNHAYFCLHASS
jgi:hypothetical protein